MRAPTGTTLIAALLMASVTARAGSATNVWETLPPARPLPVLTTQDHITHEGARIWFAVLGTGEPVVLLHGGLSSSDAWGDQIPALLESHHRVILIDSRGHGRSTLGERSLSYELMAIDVLAVMDHLHIQKPAVVGWSDGAIIGLIMAMKDPTRVSAVYAFGANMDTRGVKPVSFSSPVLAKLSRRLAEDYARVSPTPDGFPALRAAVSTMQKVEPDYSAADLAAIHGPRVAVVDGDHEEFITRAHTEYLAHTIPGAKLIFLPGVSHFAPWQAPDEFNRSMLTFLGVLSSSRSP